MSTETLTNYHATVSFCVQWHITFWNDTLEDLKRKLGEETVVHHYGFYGRVYKWKMVETKAIYGTKTPQR